MYRLNYKALYQAITGAFFAAALLSPPIAQAETTTESSTAVIFVYQRIGEDSVPQSNISVEQLKEHINQLKSDGYAVLPLSQIINAIQNGKKLPPKTVGITFEGAYQTTLTNAVPLLEAENMPFTIFFSSDPLDTDNPTRMGWKQIKKLQKNKLVTFGILPSVYEHMINKTPEENAQIINKAVARYREMMGEDPVFFAYPYGEFNNNIKKQLENYKFKAIFGQHSGVIHGGSDFLALPRFTMTNEYGDLDRFMLTANARPLYVTDITPEDTVITQNPPLIGFTLPPDTASKTRLSCFASGIGKLPVSRIGSNRIEIRPPQPFGDRRTRINCTMPNDVVIPGEPVSWRWFGMMLLQPSLDDDASVIDSPPSEEYSENQQPLDQ